MAPRYNTARARTNGCFSDPIRHFGMARNHRRGFHLRARAPGSGRDCRACSEPNPGLPRILVARDTRFFSEEFARTAAAVLAEHGVNVLFCSAAVPTPAVAYEVRRRKLDGAINFTASHNPAEYHGLKFSGPEGGPALPEETHDIESRTEALAARSQPGGSAFPAPLEQSNLLRV